MVISPLKSDFLFWWVFGLILCQIFAATLAGLALAAKSPKFMEIAVVAYWILLGIMQWRLLKPYVCWAYQWGLVTTVSGILSSWLILTLFSHFFPGEKRLSASEGILGLFFIIQIGGIPSFFSFTPTVADAIAVATSAGILAGIPCVIGILMGFIQWLLLKQHVPDAVGWMALGSLAWLIMPVALLVGVPGGYALIFLVGPIALFIAGVLGGVIQGTAMMASLQALPVAHSATSSVASWKALAETGGILVAIVAVLYPFRYSVLKSLEFTSVLNDALVSGKIDASAYFSQGGDSNYRDWSGRSLLHQAAWKNNVSLAKTLLERGVDPNVREDRFGETPLYYAQSQEFAELLIAHKADVNTQDKKGSTPLHVTPSRAIAEVLVNRGANVNLRDSKGRTALHNPNRSWISGEAEDIFKLILERGADVNTQDNQGRTPLHTMASWSVNAYTLQKEKLKVSELTLKLAKLLIKYGANVNAQDSKGSTPLHQVERLDLARVLIENGANINMRNNEGRTPLHTAAKRHLDITKLIVEQGADINALDKHGKTPLHAAQEGSRQQVIKLLIERGAKVDAKDNLGKTTLHYSAGDSASKAEEIIELLINGGADVNARDLEGKTPLYYSVEKREKKNALVLIDRGANLNVRDNKGQTLIDVVNSKKVIFPEDFEKQKEFINFLLSH